LVYILINIRFWLINEFTGYISYWLPVMRNEL